MKSTFNFKLIGALGAVLTFVACTKQVQKPADNFIGNPVEKLSMANSKPSSYTGSTTLGDTLSKFRNYTGSTGTADSVRTR